MTELVAITLTAIFYTTTFCLADMAAALSGARVTLVLTRPLPGVAPNRALLGGAGRPGRAAVRAIGELRSPEGRGRARPTRVMRGRLAAVGRT